jgi:hypothetical protein
VHGLLQTQKYATAVIAADDRLDEDVLERRVRFRMERQATVLNGDAGRSVVIVLGEAALRLVVGSSKVMAAQLEHLRAVELDVRVLPFSAGAYPRRGSFALLDFDHDDDPSVAYVEGPGAARYFDRPSERAEYEHVFDVISKRTVPIGEWSP